MALNSEEYIAKVEEFLSQIGVTGTHFCAQQYARWRGLARKAFEEASSTPTKEATTTEKSSKGTEDSD